MSKLSKLIKHPILFFKDTGKKKEEPKKPVAKKPVAKKPEPKKPVAKKPEPKKPEPKKPVAKKPVAKKPVAKKPEPKKPEPKKPVAKETIKEDIQVFTKVKNIFSTVINEIPVANASLAYHEVGLYFAGGMGNIYQVEQWIGALKELDKKKKIVLIVRMKDVYEWVKENTDFVVVYCRTIADITMLFEENNFKCILYVNHAFKNFQSLIVGNVMHVHINHGESDKTSTITNQSKGYDYIFIVGDAAYDKYNLNLIKKNMDNFIQIGRPQLDHIEEIEPLTDDKLLMKVTHEEEKNPQKDRHNNRKGINATSKIIQKKKKVILYAPTWEGTHDSMNFTSLNDYGMSLVQQLVNHPDYYLLYKPHPNTGSRDAASKSINEAILKLLSQNKGGESILSGDINSLYNHVDLAIFDNSAVAIDYLQVDKPMIMTDMFHRIKDRQSKPTITKAARMLSTTDAYSIPMIVSQEIEHDTLKKERNKIKHYFLGRFDYSKRESTNKFISTILEIIKERDILVDDLVALNEKHKAF